MLTTRRRCPLNVTKTGSAAISAPTKATGFSANELALASRIGIWGATGETGYIGLANFDPLSTPLRVRDKEGFLQVPGDN